MRTAIFAALLALLPLAANAAGDPLPAGYLSVSGNQIVSGGGQNVRLACVGYNEPTGNYASDMSIIRAAGFNCVRYPYYDLNLNLTTMDAIVSAAAANNIRVIFDHHGNEADNTCLGQQNNGLWYDKNDTTGTNSNNTDGCGVTGTITYGTFKANWVTIATHYASNATVIGFDLNNEPLVATAYTNAALTWGTSTNAGSDVQAMCQDVGTAIHAVNGGALIICEGPINYQDTTLSGVANPLHGLHDLTNAAAHPVNIAGKVVYSVHDYPSDISGITPDNGSTKIAAMNTMWGFIVKNGTAPVWVGEFGASLDNSNGNQVAEQAWAKTITDYMNGLDGGSGGPTFSGTQQPISGDWWTFGYLPGQTVDGILNSDNSLKASQQTYWSTSLYHSSSVATTTWNPNDASSMALSNNNLLATSVLTSGSYITPGVGSFTDGSGNVWTISTSGNDLLENGAQLPGDAGAGTSAAEYYNSQIYAQDGTTGTWYIWNGSFFAQSSAPPSLAAAGGVRSTTGKSSGLACAQVMINTMTNHAGVGIGAAADALNGYLGGSGSSSIGLFSDFTGQQIVLNGAVAASNNSLAHSGNGDVVTIIVDAANRLVWFSNPEMVAGGTPWNDSASANPTSGTGGISIAAISPPYYIEVNTQEATTAFTINPTPSNCPASVPTWDTTVAIGRPITVILGANQPFDGVVTPVTFPLPR